MTNTRGKKTVVPVNKKRKGSGATSSSANTEVRHPFLQFLSGPQEELFQILRARPRGVDRCIDWAALEQIHLADTVRGLLTTASWDEQSSSLTFIGQMSPHGIQSMLHMRMIERRRGFDPPQYRLARATDEDDAEDSPDDIPIFQEDPPSQPPPSHRPVHVAASISEVSDHLHRFEQYCTQRFDSIKATLKQICQHFHISPHICLWYPQLEKPLLEKHVVKDYCHLDLAHHQLIHPLLLE
ncbi:hypothetical protein GOBAR_AA19402 [Gossypium barbadense]|uniref:Uncharacterized protein n=1 Tax=Gossypium barbadense TaxID=3634 RepID=A0A2P5XD48_GOSBA|nr:hypothetical protein GOBAR_AA19402 [Gossypium barbadense]